MIAPAAATNTGDNEHDHRPTHRLLVAVSSGTCGPYPAVERAPVWGGSQVPGSDWPAVRKTSRA